MLWPCVFESRVSTKPVPISLCGKRYVAWRHSEGISVAPDACPHRLASLSTGRVRDGLLECQYHGYTYAPSGTCVGIPQSAKKPPRACDLCCVSSVVEDGILWVDDGGAPLGKSTQLLETLGRSDIVTERTFEFPWPWEAQIENNLDVAHLHYVHDGFQGSRARASPIECTRLTDSDTEMHAYFEHESDTPDVDILWLKPGVVRVGVVDKRTKEVVRINVVYIHPVTDSSCGVLFRDVAFNVTMQDPELYRIVYRAIIDRIFAQDYDALKSVAANIPTSAAHLSAKYVLPTPADASVLAFRRWRKRQ